MKTIIAGSRDITDYKWIERMSSVFNITEVVSGRCRGVDMLGEEYAKKNNIPIKPFPADWEKYGNRAGFIRNAEMADYGEALLAFWDGKSKGTKNMIDNALKKNLFVSVFYTRTL